MDVMILCYFSTYFNLSFGVACAFLQFFDVTVGNSCCSQAPSRWWCCASAHL